MQARARPSMSRVRWTQRTRVMNLFGTNVTSDLIIRDKYRVTISPDGRSLSGVSYGGKTRGQLTMRK